MALAKWISDLLLNGQVAAAEHLRDCGKCRHLFEVAYEEADSGMVLGLNAFFVTTQIIRELRRCPDWPKNV